MIELLGSWRDSPDIPNDWRPRPQPGTILKVKIKNLKALAALRTALPGNWQKVYHVGADGSAIHYFQHASGQVSCVKYKAKTQ